jgi:hypothetical protein
MLQASSSHKGCSAKDPRACCWTNTAHAAHWWN